MSISVVIIVKNEAENLQRLLPTLAWANEILILDDHSTDNTKEIAEASGAVVFQHRFESFGKQKQKAVSLAENDWILSLDADEILTEALLNEIQALDLSNTQIHAFEIPRTHVFLGKVFKHGKESNDLIVRLFNKKYCNFDDAVVHEKVIVKGKAAKLSHPILHHSYKDLVHYFQKFNTYTTQGAIKLHKKGKQRSLTLCFLSFPVYFFKHYFIYLNCLNGWQGLVWSYLSAGYHVVKYLKLFELNKKLNS